MLRPKPPHGWNAVAWELAIVTVGVLMALALQQWAENLAAQSRITRAREAIRQELREHYLNAVEWRTFSPCITGQLERIERRIPRSNALLQPIEVYRIAKIRRAVMAPGRIYDDSAWRGAINDGTAFQLADLERKRLTNEHAVANEMDKTGNELMDADEQLLAASRPIELDPGVRLALLHSIDRMHAANEHMNRSAAEIMYWVGEFDAAPTRTEVQSDLARNSSSMREFCRDQRLAARDLATALNPNS